MIDDRFILKPVAYLWAWRLSLLLYALAFVLPYGFATPEYVPGVVLFWWGLLFCYVPYCYPWWANVLFWVALGQSRQRPTWLAFSLALLAFLASLSWMLLVEKELPPGPAYAGWTGSMGILTLGLFVSLSRFDLPRDTPFEDEGDRVPLPPLSPVNPHIQPPHR